MCHRQAAIDVYESDSPETSSSPGRSDAQMSFEGQRSVADNAITTQIIFTEQRSPIGIFVCQENIRCVEQPHKLAQGPHCSGPELGFLRGVSARIANINGFVSDPQEYLPDPSRAFGAS